MRLEKTNPTIESLSKHLFWDVDRSALDFDKNEKIIIQRVLEYGLLEDWRIIKEYYGLPRIIEIVKTFRTLEPSALSFVASLANIPLTDFRCYNSRLSTTTHWHRK
jgi:hypothetical protein